MTTPESDRVFAGSVPDAYEQWLVPMIFEPYAADIAQRLSAMQSGSILEIAAGTGVVTRALAAALPSEVPIVATDLNQGMIDRAVQMGTARPVTWKEANVMSLPFDNDSFNVVVCQFGVMFFDPKADAHTEVRRVLRPGGQFLFNVWDRIEDNEFTDEVVRAVATLFPDDPPLFLQRTPHGYHDPEAIAADLRAGGFSAPPSIERVEHRSRANRPEDVAAAFCLGTPMRGEIVARGQGRLTEAESIAAAAVAERFGHTNLEGRISAQVISATK